MGSNWNRLNVVYLSPNAIILIVPVLLTIILKFEPNCHYHHYYYYYYYQYSQSTQLLNDIFHGWLEEKKTRTELEMIHFFGFALNDEWKEDHHHSIAFVGSFFIDRDEGTQQRDAIATISSSVTMLRWSFSRSNSELSRVVTRKTKDEIWWRRWR